MRPGALEVSRGDGVIQDPIIHRRVLDGDPWHLPAEQGFGIRGLIRSPLKGPKGNIEFLVHLVYPGESISDIGTLVETAMAVERSRWR